MVSENVGTESINLFAADVNIGLDAGWMMEAFQRVKVRSKLLKDALECDGDEGCGCGLAAVW